jgi:hypothetical protein
VLDMTRTERDARMLPPRVVDPSRMDVRIGQGIETSRLRDAVSALTARAKAAATTPVGIPGRDRRVVFGRNGRRRIMDALAFPYHDPDLAFCAFLDERAIFAWKHEGRSWTMAVAVTSTTGMPSARRASRAAINVLDTVGCMLDVACGRIRGIRTGGEASDRIGTTARLATIGCCQSGHEHASMNFADERVVGTGRTAMPMESNLTLSAQGAALVPQLPSTVLISLGSLHDPGTTFIDIHSPIITGRMPEDPMERLRVLADAEGLPILYRWVQR